MNSPDQVILVDSQDQPIGTAEKLEAHETGQLHRAFSILIFNDQGQMMLQQRNEQKYHSGGLWTNTCCSHPRPDESTKTAAHRRLVDEMGFDCDLQHLFHFTYKVQLSDQLFEHELDHVFMGFYNQDPKPNPVEASNWKWMGLAELRESFQKQPEEYTYWMGKILEHPLEDYLQSHAV